MNSSRILYTIFAIALFIVPAPIHAVDLIIKEWATPPNTFPHDPAVSADGALWYTGMMSNTIGRMDPESGEMKEYKLPISESGPHGLAADKDGNIWFTANHRGYIGRLNPATGDVKEYQMPDKSARDPHSLVIDSRGIVWFTVQFGNFLGIAAGILGNSLPSRQ